MEKKFTDFVPLEEGINDPAIFKAVFLAGGPGSGKSFMVGQTGLNSLGFKVVNSDQQFEVALKKAGMSQTPDDIFSTKGQSLRDRAKFITAKRKSGFLDGRLGLVIDGTGRDYEKISKQKRELEKLGYETAMIMVNTSLQTAVGRDKARDRTLGKDAITPMWKSVQQNIGKFSNLFKQNFFIVDNSDGADFKKGALSVYRNISAWSKRPPQKPIAQRWIKNEMQKRNIKRESVPDDENYIDEACWVGWKQKGMKKKGNRMVPNCVKEDDMDEAFRLKKSKPSAQERFNKRLKDKHGIDLDANLKYYKSVSDKYKQKMKDANEESNPRIPRKKGQPANSKKHSDLYTDENPKGTIHGLGFKDVATAKESVSKIRGSSRSHAHKIQAAVAMEQRAREMGKTSEAAVYRKFINTMKKKTKKMNEDIKKMDMGDVIKDFYKSDAPQFKGKSKKKRREMAIAAKLQSQEEELSFTAEDLRKWFGKGPKGDWVRVGTDGEIKGKCAREPGEGKPKCMPRSKAHSMSKDDRATSARRKRRKDPVADRPGKGGKPIMVKTDVKKEEYKYEWGTPEATAYMKALTPGEPGDTTKKNKTSNKYHYKAKEIVERRRLAEEDADIEVLEMDVDSIFTAEEITDMEIQIDNMDFDDLVDLGMYDEDELIYIDDEDEGDIHDDIEITEVLSIQGRMKRRFAARRNRQKLKVARMRAARRASDPGRLKRRATRGARNMIKARIARGRDIQSLPPAEKARIETMAKRFSGLVARMATRLAPVVRRNELKRLTSRNRKPMKAKKYNPARAKAQASKQKAKKFKVKKK